MQRKIIATADGSKTIHLPEWNEQYHSKHGAVQEAYHVFIKMGLNFVMQKKQELDILEIGFGTGLNGLISFVEAERQKLKINYTGVEAFPVSKEEIEALNYSEVLQDSSEAIFQKIHELQWEEMQPIASFFSLRKQKKLFESIEDVADYDLIYFDAFGPRVQPTLWTEHIFGKMYTALKPKGILVTYSAKGSVRRAMEAVGFEVERLPGPPGKREMLRGTK